MDYESSMTGLQQIFDAILGQQMQPQQIEVDEMRRGQQEIADSIADMTANKSTGFSTGLDAMMAAKRAAGEKEHKVTGGAYAPRGL